MLATLAPYCSCAQTRLRLLRRLRRPATYTPADFKRAAKAYLAQHGTLVAEARYEAPGNIFWDDDQYNGDAYPTYAWAVYVAEVAVDTLTYSAEVTDFHALQEVGKVIHPVLAKGQIEGGVAQGIGYALYEKCVYKDGLMRNNQMTNYIMPTSADLPPIHVHFEETPSIHGPGGAKGIGELPMDGPAPAILNAIEHATGIAFTEIPLLPEDIFERMTGTPDSGTEDLNPSIDRDTRTETRGPRMKIPAIAAMLRHRLYRCGAKSARHQTRRHLRKTPR